MMMALLVTVNCLKAVFMVMVLSFIVLSKINGNSVVIEFMTDSPKYSIIGTINTTFDYIDGKLFRDGSLYLTVTQLRVEISLWNCDNNLVVTPYIFWKKHSKTQPPADLLEHP